MKDRQHGFRRWNFHTRVDFRFESSRQLTEKSRRGIDSPVTDFSEEREETGR